MNSNSKEIEVKKILNFLYSEYPNAKCDLNFTNALELLIATILSAQCTDKRVNIVTEKLFKKYKSPEDFVKVPVEELAEDIRPTGIYNIKSKNIQECCRSLIDNFGSMVPQTMEELTSLAGVGRKTANVILGNVFKIPGIVVDTHVKRLSNRMGLTYNSNPEKIEIDLMSIIPRNDWTMFSHMMIYHGRNLCNAKKPVCTECRINDFCPSNEA